MDVTQRQMTKIARKVGKFTVQTMKEEEIGTAFYEWLLEDLPEEEKESFCKTLDKLYWKSKRERQAGFENITQILAKKETEGDEK